MSHIHVHAFIFILYVLPGVFVTKRILRNMKPIWGYVKTINPKSMVQNQKIDIKRGPTFEKTHLSCIMYIVEPPCLLGSDLNGRWQKTAPCFSISQLLCPSGQLHGLAQCWLLKVLNEKSWDPSRLQRILPTNPREDGSSTSQVQPSLNTSCPSHRRGPVFGHGSRCIPKESQDVGHENTHKAGGFIMFQRNPPAPEVQGA